MKLKSFFALICLIAVTAFAAGCGGDGAGYPSADDVKVPDAGATEETADEKSDSKPGKTPTVSGGADEKPEISEASGEPPTKLIEEDIKKGSGAAAKDGDTVSVNYVGKNWSNNQEFDTSWGKEPFEFELGGGNVIQGWDQGVVGMKEGGRRLLIIPPDLGYGAQGQGSIPANETLMFVVDLEEIK
ncbi:MAG: FKBP-type peptidyl-prolyl cis-trans isomerase [Solirubrobacterales bacterium]